MRYYETEHEFIELKQGEVCPKDYKEKEIHSIGSLDRTYEFPLFNLSIRLWYDDKTPYCKENFNRSTATYTYKGISFYPANDIVSKDVDSILIFLNKLKKGNAEEIMKDLIISSLKVDPSNFNLLLNRIDSLTKERDELTKRISDINQICNLNN